MTTLENRPNTALLIVDVQNSALDRAYERDAVVAAVSDGWQILPELRPGDDEPLVEKHHGDSFEDTTLETALAGLGVGRLVVAGAQKAYQTAPGRTAGTLDSKDVDFGSPLYGASTTRP